MVKSIQEEIKQSSDFKSPYSKSLVNILFTSSWLSNHLTDLYKSYGITTQQYNVLRILNGANEPLSVLEIRNRMLEKMSDTSRLIDRMFKSDLVEKYANSIDRRSMNIVISEKGKALLKNMDEDGITRKLNYEIGTCLTVAEAELLSNLLDKFRCIPTE